MFGTTSGLYGARRVKNIVAQVLATIATIFGLFWLTWIVWTTLRNGISALDPISTSRLSLIHI